MLKVKRTCTFCDASGTGRSKLYDWILGGDARPHVRIRLVGAARVRHHRLVREIAERDPVVARLPRAGIRLYSTWMASTDGFTDSFSNQPWKFTVVVASGCALNDGDVSAPKYAWGDVQPFFDVWSTA